MTDRTPPIGHENHDAAFGRRSKPIIAILGCPACNGRGDGCQECAEQGWIITEPTEPPVVYMTRARYDELREGAKPKTGFDALSDANKAEWTAMIREQRDPETKACTCGYPKKECLRVVLRNGPPYPPRPCEPEPTICDAKPPSHMKPCQKRAGHGGAHGTLDGSQGWR